MALLNLRLGYYVRRPGPNGARPSRPNHYYPSALFAIPGLGCSERSGYLELSDGGHFENLGVYELLRRRCGLIIVCDGGQDAQASYSDFVTALHRVGQDFGVTVHFDVTIAGRISGPQDLIARPRDDTYPKGAEYASKGYFLATVDYGRRGGHGWPKQGLLIYMKTAMIEELKMEAKGYKGAHPDFPDETTADQFFDEEQFRSYREVGYRIADQMIGDLDLERKLAHGRPALSDLLSPGKRPEGVAAR